MGPEQIRAKMLEISNRLEEIQAGEEGYSEEQITEVNGLNEQFESFSAQLETAEKVEAMKAKTTASAGRKSAPAPTGSKITTVEVMASEKQKRFGGFNSSGEFIQKVRAATLGDVDKRFQNVLYEKSGTDGGWLVPADMSDVILKKFESDESLMSRVNTINLSSNNMTIMLDESQPWGASAATAYWVAEGAPIPETRITWTRADFRLHKIGAMIKATDELLDDAPALESLMKAAVPSAMMYKVNNSIISGDGVGKPQGFLSSPHAVTVAKESGQLADTILPANLLKMRARLRPGANAAWFVNAAVVEELYGLKNTAGDYIYLSPGGQMNQTPYASLLGLPVIPMLSGMPALGDSGDVVLADLSSYWLARKGGIKEAQSIHLHFDREITAFRFTMRVDGKVPYQSPITSEFGNYQMSSIVKLADRA